MKECFISVDVETTGPTPGSYSMFEIGATRVENPEWDFNASLKVLPGARFEQEALRAIGRTQVELKQPTFGTEPREVMQHFADWVKAQSRGRGRPVFVANNAPFDWMFVAWYFEKFGIENPFGYSAFDMKAYFMGLTRCSWEKATLANMAKYAGVKFKKLPHRALKDAILQSRVFARLLAKGKKEFGGQNKEPSTPPKKWDLFEAVKKFQELAAVDIPTGIEHPKTHCPKCGAPPEEQEVYYYYRRNDPRTYCKRCDAFVPELTAG